MTETSSHLPLHVALVGYGYAGKTFHAPLLECTPGLDLSVIVSGDAAKVARDYPACQVLAFAEMLDRDIDLVVIATPNSTHFDLARKALLAGKHVVVDKPFTLDVAQAEELQAVATRMNLMLTVFHNRRWDGDFLTLRELVMKGELGRIAVFESRFDRYRLEVRDRWRERPEPGAGTWFDLGPHLVDQALLLFGMPLGVSADLAIQRDHGLATDFFHVVLRYPTLRVILSSSYLAASPGPRFRVFGTGGSYVKHGFDVQETDLLAGLRPLDHAAWGEDPVSGTLTRMQDGNAMPVEITTTPGNYPAFYAQVRDALSGNAPPPVSTAEILSVMRIIELAGASAQGRHEILVS